ncbi:MAG: NAD(P)/FAD-dependent oxidoreductase, partial [Nocardia sp.]|nr:NAD(P)/FAD-dependent oxidoreductase [Nocardia sp.]
RKRARLSRSPRMAFERAWWWAVGELASLGLVEAPIVARGLSKWALHNLNSNVGDPTLREILTPDYPLGCKRTLFSSDYYPALNQPNVTVTTDAISEITPAGVRTAGGVDHPADVIIYGTGFKATEFLWPMRITGREGKELSKVWADGAHAYYGISVPEFPNFFMVYGPNTNLGSNSIIHMIESQSRHIRQAVRLLAEDPGTVIEVRADTERYYNDQLQRRLERTPWNYCTSWYRTASGKITNNWPGGVTRYRRRAAHLDRDDYSLTHIG